MTVCKGLIPDEVCGLFLFPASCPVLLHTVSFKRDFFLFPASCPVLLHSLFQKGLFLFPATCPVLITQSLSKGTFSVSCQLSCTFAVSFKRDFFCFLPVVLYFRTQSLSKGTFSVSCQLSCTFSHSFFQKGLFLFPASCPVLFHTVSFKRDLFCFLPVVLYFCIQSLLKGTFVYTHILTQNDFRSNRYFDCFYCYGYY